MSRATVEAPRENLDAMLSDNETGAPRTRR